MTPQTPKKNAPRRPGWFRRVFNADRAVMAGGLGLAAFAAFFPWYVFMHQDEFGVRPMTYSNGGNFPGWGGRGVSQVPAVAMTRDEDDDPGLLSSSFDFLATATVPDDDLSMVEERAENPLAQPFPAVFRLLHVANGRALIEDNSGMYVVRLGSVLPDESRLARLERRDGDWVIVTSTGAVITR